jgi:PAS domain S-box-containing protein
VSLSESERARLLELTHDAIIVRDFDGTIRFWNRGAEEVYGWPSAAAVGRVSHALLATEFPQPLEEVLVSLRTDGRWDGELRHVRADGQVVVVQSRWVLSDEGGTQRVLEINTDITARKRAEDRARTQEACVNAALRHADLVLFAQDADLRYTWARNVRLGFDDDSLVGLSDDVLDEGAESLTVFKRAVLQTGRGGRRVVRASHAGQEGWFDVSVEPLTDAQGRVVGITGSSFDVSEVHRLADEAIAEKRHLDLVLRVMRLGVFEWDLRTGRVTWSPECYELFGVQEFGGTFEAAMAFLHPEDRDRMAAAPPPYLMVDEPNRLEFRIIRPDGEVRWLFNLVETIRDEAGQPTRQVGVVGDITEHRRDIDALQSLTAREREVLRLIADGKSSKEIGSVLGISAKTAETHRTNLMRKLDLHSVGALVRFAVRARLVEP